MSKNFAFHNGKKLLEHCAEYKMPIWEVMLNYEIQMSGKPEEEIYEMLHTRLQVIFDAVQAAIDKPEMSPSGMVGKSTPILAKAFAEYDKTGGELLLNKSAIAAMLGAVATGENNARMGVILAFPTAGAAGVLPGVIYGARERFGLNKEQMVQMMLTASAIGIVIANTATLSGAAGGCQAEVGSASAMAAASFNILISESVLIKRNFSISPDTGTSSASTPLSKVL